MSGWLARRLPTAMLARRNLSRARARSGLAVLGIVIGVVAIASLGVFGAAFKASFLQGATIGQSVIVTPGEDAGGLLSGDDLRSVRATVDGDATVYGVRQRRVRFGHLRTSASVTAYGIEDPGRFVSASAGRVPDTLRDGVLVGVETADRHDVSVGDSVTVDGESYRVVGVLERQPRAGTLRDLNDGVLLPPGAFDRGYSRVEVRHDSPAAAAESADALRAELDAGRRDRYRVVDFQEAIERFNQQTQRINTFLLGIGAVSLLVAGISILNVQLMSVIERREEIGVLRAVGFGRFDVLRLLLAEAALLGVAGAAVGGVISVGLGMVINQALLSDPTAFTPAAVRSLAQGVAFGLLAAVVSGLYPAWKAANERPVEALRG
ncbi:MAG: ABC transporter permease [Halolamina sp.]